MAIARESNSLDIIHSSRSKETRSATLLFIHRVLLALLWTVATILQSKNRVQYMIITVIIYGFMCFTL